MNGLYNLGRRKSPWDLEKPLSLSTYSPDIEERSRFQFSDIEPLVEPDMTPITPEIKTLATGLGPETKKTTGLLDYWKQPVFGKIPLDQFVRLAGMLGQAIAPEEPMGRVGGVLGQMGGQAYAERVKREEEELERQRQEPDTLLKRQYLQAQIKKLGELKEPKIPTTWEAFYPDYMKRFPGTSVGEAVKAFREAEALPKEPKEPSPHYVPTIQDGMFGKYDVTTETFTPIRKATPKDIEDVETGKMKELKEYQPHQYIKPDGTLGWVEPGKEVPKGWKPYERPERPEKLTIADIKSAYSMDIGNIKNQMMVDMTPDEQMNLAGQPDVNILALLLSGRVGKSLSPEKKKYYTEKLREAEKYYGDLTNQVLGRKGAKVPPKSPSVTAPEVVPKIFKDKQGREMVRDPNSKTGWRYK